MDFKFQSSHARLLKIWQPNVDLAEEPTSSHAQVKVELVVQKVDNFIDIPNEGGEYLTSVFEVTKLEMLHFDPHNLMWSYHNSYIELWRKLTMLGIMPCFRNDIIKKIIRFGQKIISEDSNMVRKSLRLHAEMEDVRTFVRGQRVFNSGESMVPASNSLIKCSRVRIEGGDCEGSDRETKRRCVGKSKSKSCVICMEDIPVGSVTCMPCWHVFHDSCIIEWLKRSHSCPVCRLKMPTLLSSLSF